MILDVHQFDLLTAIAGNPDALMASALPDHIAGPAMRRLISLRVIVPASAPTGWSVTQFGQDLIKLYLPIVAMAEARYA